MASPSISRLEKGIVLCVVVFVVLYVVVYVVYLPLCHQSRTGVCQSPATARSFAKTP